MSKAAVTLKVMQFNIENGGHGVDFSSVGKAILAADADVVAIQEGCATMPEIAADLGWEFWDARTQVVSKYPLLTPADVRPGAILVEAEPGKVFALVNVHPPSRGFGPTRAARGKPAEKIRRREKQVRLPALIPSIDTAKALVQQGIPVILLGDFNAPSHRDWTQQTVGLRSHVKYPMRWPTSVAVEAAGLVDVYRALYPDPVTHQGLTWPALRPFVRGYNPGAARKAADRIDLMFVSDAIKPKSMQIVGEEQSPMSDITVTPWPTDHRALVAQLQIQSGAAPTLVSIDRQCSPAGDERILRYEASDADAARIEVLPASSGTYDPVVTIALDDHSRGAVQLSTTRIPPGTYDIALVNSENSELVRARFWLTEAGASPGLTLEKTTYRSGELIEASWTYGPGNKSDWIGVYERGADPRTAKSPIWEYIDGRVEGRFTFNEHVRPRRWPLSEGEYSVYLMQDDSRIKLAQADFAVGSI